MKTISLTETEHSNLTDYHKELFKLMEQQGACFKFKLGDVLEEKKISIRECARLTGLRPATISDLVNGKKSSINLHHICILMRFLNLASMTDIVEIVMP